MPSVRCPKCQAENEYPDNRAGKALTCNKCGRAIPAQLTVSPNAKPRVRPPGKGSGKANMDDDERLSFAEAAISRISGTRTSWMAMTMVGLSAFALLGGIFWVLHSSQMGPPPPIVESSQPAAQITQMIVSFQPPDYVFGFTLLDSNDKEIARSGRVKLTVSEITRLALQGSGSFEKETKLYESTFDVNPTHFSWYETGGVGFKARRLLCGVRVPSHLLSRMPPDHAEGKVTVRFFDGQDETKMTGFYKKFFFSSVMKKKPAPTPESAPASPAAAK
ncbi:MAG: hypothetical protein HZC54_03710 [Verrucomicrobia bacterium]|nr:hypothetical protein [Verrucomicrobiota bacterium]